MIGGPPFLSTQLADVFEIQGIPSKARTSGLDMRASEQAIILQLSGDRSCALAASGNPLPIVVRASLADQYRVFIGFHLFFMQNGGVNAISEGFKSAFGLLVPLDLDPKGQKEYL
jgi:hypothetical protein